MSSIQCGASIHVVLGLEDVDHFVRVEFEHALHLLLFQGFLAPLAGFLVHLLSALLVLPDPSQVSVREHEETRDEAFNWKRAETNQSNLIHGTRVRQV